MKKIENKTAIVTGAASGMGRAIALLFAEEGANVIAADLKREAVEEVVNVIAGKGGRATGVVCNVAEESSVQNMIDTAVQKYKTLDILVNNAGIMDDFMPVAKVSNQLWNKVMAVNLNGPFYACRL